MGTSLSWTVCNAEERQCAGLFLEVSDPRAAHSALCSDAQLSMQYLGLVFGCSQSLPVRSPSLAVPSSDCSSYGNTEKRRCIQDRQKWAKTDWKHYDWQEWWADSTEIRSIQGFKLTFRVKDDKQMTTLEEKKYKIASKSSIVHSGTCLHWNQHFYSFEYMKTRMIVQMRAVFIIMKILPWWWDERQELVFKLR